MPEVNLYKEHMVLPCAYFFIAGMKDLDLHNLVVRLEYTESDYKANTVSVEIIDKDYVLVNKNLRGSKVYAMFGHRAKLLEFNGFIAKTTPTFSNHVSVELFCMDGSYPLSITDKSRSWANCRRGDVARKIAIENGLVPAIESMGAIQDKITQTNESDMQLLQKLADEETKDSIGISSSAGVGQTMYVAKVKNGTLYFGQRKLNGDSLRTLWYNINDCSIISMTPTEVTNVNTITPKGGKGGKLKVNSGSGDVSGKVTPKADDGPPDARSVKAAKDARDPLTQFNKLIPKQWEKLKRD